MQTMSPETMSIVDAIYENGRFVSLMHDAAAFQIRSSVALFSALSTPPLRGSVVRGLLPPAAARVRRSAPERRGIPKLPPFRFAPGACSSGDPPPLRSPLPPPPPPSPGGVPKKAGAFLEIIQESPPAPESHHEKPGRLRADHRRHHRGT
jgi:hypothetical protein